MSAFPLDYTTLMLLDAACQINPDSGHTELGSFLDMGSVVKSETLISGGGPDGPPIYEVEYEDGFEPFTEHNVIRALVTEVLRLRDICRGCQSCSAALAGKDSGE